MRTSTLCHAFITVAILVIALTFPAQAQDKGKTADKNKAPAKNEKAEKSKKEEKAEKPAKSVTAESFGQLTLGAKPASVEKLLGKPESKGKKTMQEATGTSIQDWNYPAKGLTITMEFADKKQETVSIIRATAACTLATARGIKIGSTEAAVAKAYGKERDKESSKAGESFVAGSLYDGIIFTLKDGKVAEIFIGAAAE